MARANKSNTLAMNQTLIAIVLGLILFGLGFVAGKAKAKLGYWGDFTQMREQLMLDKTIQQTVIDKMMQDDDSRQMLMKAVDDYRASMMKKK